MRLVRFAIGVFPAKAEIASGASRIGEVDISMAKGQAANEKQQDFLITVKVDLAALPEKDDSGRILIPTAARELCEFAIDALCNASPRSMDARGPSYRPAPRLLWSAPLRKSATTWRTAKASWLFTEVNQAQGTLSRITRGPQRCRDPAERGQRREGRARTTPTSPATRRRERTRGDFDRSRHLHVGKAQRRDALHEAAAACDVGQRQRMASADMKKVVRFIRVPAPGLERSPTCHHTFTNCSRPACPPPWESSRCDSCPRTES